MITTTTLFALSIIVAVVLFVRAVKMVGKSILAERTWVQAVQRNEAVRSVLMADLQRSAGTEQLARSLARLVRQMESDHLLSAAQRAQIEAPLHQPSEIGRRAYAMKLATEGVQGRMILH